MMTPSTSTGLSKDWVLSPSIDLELKRYVLLGYLQRVGERFAEQKLYPHLEQVYERATELLRLQRSKEEWAQRLAGPAIKFDPNTGNAVRERPAESELLRTIDEVVEFAITELREAQENGAMLRDELSRRVHLNVVGVLPMYTAEGWLLLRSAGEARVYTYKLTWVKEERTELLHRNVVTSYVQSCALDLGHTFERIKSDLIRWYPRWPNPATFSAEADIDLPCVETFLPLVKRQLHAQVNSPAA